MITLDRILPIYTDSGYGLDLTGEESQEYVHQRKFSILSEYRQKHQDSAKELLNTFKKVIKNSLTETSDNYCLYNDKVHPFVITVFSELLRQSSLQMNWESIQQVDELIDMFKFIEEVL